MPAVTGGIDGAGDWSEYLIAFSGNSVLLTQGGTHCARSIYAAEKSLIIPALTDPAGSVIAALAFSQISNAGIKSVLTMQYIPHTSLTRQASATEDLSLCLRCRDMFPEFRDHCMRCCHFNAEDCENAVTTSAQSFWQQRSGTLSTFIALMIALIPCV